MNDLLATAVKVLLFLIFLPLLLCLALQVMVTVISAVVPWLLLAGAIVSVVAGLTAGLTLLRRLPPRQGSGDVPHGEPIRRPRGRGHQEE